MTTILTYNFNSNDYSSDISNIIVYFNKEIFKKEKINESIEKISKKSEIIAKTSKMQTKSLVSVKNYNNIYFDEKDLKEEEEESNKIKLNNKNNSSNF